MKKKILFVINSLECGGAEKSLISLLSSFDYEKYEVYLQMFRLEGMFLRLLPEEVIILPEIEYLKFSKQSFFKQLKNPRLLGIKMRTSVALRYNQRTKILHDAQCYWKNANKAFRKLKDQYDVAVAWGQGNPTHFVCEKVNAKKKIAFINADYEAVGHNKKFDSSFYEKYSYVVTVSDELRKLITLVFSQINDRIVTVYDINNAELIKRMSELENPFEEATNKIRLITVGRLVSQKGYDLLTKACKVLKEENLNFEWHIIGEGPKRNDIEKDIEKYRIEDYLFLHGAKDNPYVYMKNADVYVQTSRNEGYCLTLGEARILNIPVVSTNFDVVYSQLRNEENGLIVEMTGEAIAEGVMKILKNEELCNKIVDNLKKEKKGNIEEIHKFYKLIEG